MSEEPNISNEALFGADRELYGDGFADHLVEQYKLYLEMADRISQRRQAANTFFMTVNTGLISFMALFAPDKFEGYAWMWLAAALAGCVLSFAWYRLIRSYKDLNSAKFKVIHAIEKRLPLQAYHAEWMAVGEGKRPDLYLPFTHIEMRIPWAFMGLYLGLAAVSLVSGLTEVSGP